MRLLVIEDDAKTAAYLCKGLSEHNFIVDTTAGGDDGLHLALTGRYDLIILDILLPQRDGWSVLTELRRCEVSASILMLTAQDAVPDRVKGLELGAADYLVKPFAFSELLARVRALLRQLLGGYGLMRTLHGLAAYVFLPYIILHVTLQWWFGQFWSIFRIQWHRPHLKAGLIGLAVSLVVVGGVYGWNQRLYTLTVPRITQASNTPLLDGKPHDAAWQHAQSVTVRTVKGINNPHDFVDVDIKALHDGERIYFRMQWDDPAVSSKRFPLLKTAEGWKVLQTAMKSSNEDVYYEDKLAVYITDIPCRDLPPGHRP